MQTARKQTGAGEGGHTAGNLASVMEFAGRRKPERSNINHINRIANVHSGWSTITNSEIIWEDG
jgi:hypothetical protein